MNMNRRSLITGLISLVAAPAIVRVQNIMPVRQMIEPVNYVIGKGHISFRASSEDELIDVGVVSNISFVPMMTSVRFENKSIDDDRANLRRVNFGKMHE